MRTTNAFVLNDCVPYHYFTDKNLISNFICPICLGIYCSPIVDECGHVFGNQCIKKYKSINHNLICPILKTSYSKDNRFTPIQPLKQFLLTLEVSCKNSLCNWKKNLNLLENHLNEECLYQMINCVHQQCKVKFERIYVSYHLKNECEFEKITCWFQQKCNCDEKISYKFMIDHLRSKNLEELREASENYYKDDKIDKKYSKNEENDLFVEDIDIISLNKEKTENEIELKSECLDVDSFLKKKGDKSVQPHKKINKLKKTSKSFFSKLKKPYIK